LGEFFDERVRVWCCASAAGGEGQAEHAESGDDEFELE
jgi:hypothetical protein